jgi:apolipoprotein N-acyltransferase
VPIGIACWFYQLSRCEPKQAKLIGWFFGLGWFGAGVSWVHVSIADFGGLPLIGSLALMFLLCGYLALFPALFAALAKRIFAPYLWPLALPFLWLLVEWLRSWLFTGFPWLSIGYSQVNSPLGGWMPVIGEVGVSVLIVFMAACMAIWLAHKKFQAPLIVCAVLLCTGWVLNQFPWVTQTNESVKIAMVQGNIKQELRWVPEQDRPTMQKYLNMTQQHWDNDIIIWPEAAIPKLEPIAIEYIAELDDLARHNQTGLITGIVNYNFETKEAHNALISIGTNGDNSPASHYRYQHNNRFYKHQLLPIGEFIPFEDWLRGLAPIFDLPMSSFNRGDFQQRNLHTGNFKLAPAICFEIAFPNQIRANLYDDTDFIITVSNDAWFGRSHGPEQHLEIAQVRAKEFGIPVLRSTNTGVTAFIDHQGKIQSRAEQFQAVVLSDNMQLVSGHTPYRDLGNIPTWLLTFFTFLMACWLVRRQR